MRKPIYLDNHATTKLDPRVLDAMMPWLTEEYGNSSSRSHPYGWRAEEAVENARDQVALLIGAKSHEIFFMSGATEANNTVIRGLRRFAKVLTSPMEHKSILAPCENLKAKDGDTAFIYPDFQGSLDVIDAVKRHRQDTALVSVMLANNEVGTIQNLHGISHAIPDWTLFHSDIAQAVGKIPVDVESIGLHLASMSAHKMYGPKGVGALYVREDRQGSIPALLHGGGQERSMRSGTLNVAGIVGFGKAAQIARESLSKESAEIRRLRDLLLSLLRESIGGINVHGGSRRLPGNLHISLPCSDMDSFMAFLNTDVALSFGSACMSASGRKSHVLEAMGVPDEEIMRSVRMCVGRFNTEEEINLAAKHIVLALDKARRGG